jgi:hypothetical protein
MKKGLLTAAAFVLLTLGASAGTLDEFLANLNVRAQTDLHSFAYQVSSQFHVGQASVDLMLGNVQQPADAFMVYHLSQACGRPPEEVYRVYQHRKGRGWGELAKELGIKPGSREFHALKNGDLRLEGDRGPGPASEPGGGPGHGKGKGKGRKHGNG